MTDNYEQNYITIHLKHSIICSQKNKGMCHKSLNWRVICTYSVLCTRLTMPFTICKIGKKAGKLGTDLLFSFWHPTLCLNLTEQEYALLKLETVTSYPVLHNEWKFLMCMFATWSLSMFLFVTPLSNSVLWVGHGRSNLTRYSPVISLWHMSNICYASLIQAVQWVDKWSVTWNVRNTDHLVYKGQLCGVNVRH
jgi:hypothetical protein